MKCPYCSHSESKVSDSRSTDEGVAIRRRRECLSCGRRFTTYEKIENIPIMVIKKDKSRQPFDRGKVTSGIMRACEKRPVSLEKIQNMVYEIESAIFNSLEREITSVKIGDMTLEKLRNVDQVAFVRFASVYREFRDIKTFREEIDRVMRGR